MFAQKPSKSQAPDKTLYTIHNIIDHSKCNREWVNNENYRGDYLVVSIDPGEVNLAIRVEKRSYDASNVETLSFNKYNLHGYGSDELLFFYIKSLSHYIPDIDKNKLNELYINIKSELFYMYGENYGRRSKVYNWNNILSEFDMDNLTCFNIPNLISPMITSLDNIDLNNINNMDDVKINIIKLLCIRYHTHKYQLQKKEYKDISSICKYIERTINNNLKNKGLNIKQIRDINKSLDEVFDRKDNRSLTSISCIYDTMTDILDHHMKYFMKCHMIIIERQREVNYKMIRCSQHIITYFLIKLRYVDTHPIIYEVSSKLKSKMLDAPPNLTPSQVKKWSVELGQLILQYRGDNKSLDMIEKASKAKKDDYCDVVVQIEALFKYIGLPTSFDKMNVKSESSFSLSADIPSSDSGGTIEKMSIDLND
uniref:Holliday junction resolvase n=1 Tax=Pithovirus LCPAC101 TaxID=2506586 RepID=A0A481Z3B7_9VIRU|nr:MAG: holliday junction resolvase [Pithovirus LCPAC101]